MSHLLFSYFSKSSLVHYALPPTVLNIQVLNISYTNLFTTSRMDIGYSVRGNFRLLKSFNDEDEKPHGGWRIWAFRLTQMFLNLGGLVAVSFATVRNYKQKAIPHWKTPFWLGIMVFELFCSVSGIFQFCFAQKIKSRSGWVLTTGVYNIIQSHVLLYGLIVGSHDVFTTYRNSPNKPNLFVPTVIGSVLCFTSSIIHFISALFPTPFPPILWFHSPLSAKSSLSKAENDSEMKMTTMYDPATSASIASSEDTTTSSMQVVKGKDELKN